MEEERKEIPTVDVAPKKPRTEKQKQSWLKCQEARKKKLEEKRLAKQEIEEKNIILEEVNQIENTEIEGIGSKAKKQLDLIASRRRRSPVEPELFSRSMSLQVLGFKHRRQPRMRLRSPILVGWCKLIQAAAAYRRTHEPRTATDASSK